MRASALNIVTYREDPADAEVASHRLLQRAGLIYKSGAGLYFYTPLMWRVLKKVQGIVCEEMDRAGALEVQMPILQDRRLWDESGRWSNYMASNTLFHLKDRKGSELCLGPTHEEVITDYARSVIRSHKQLPVTYYQLHTKFRDEIRPRFGLMRVKEFLMKDAYSFDIGAEGLDRSYDAMAAAYGRIFARLGLDAFIVDADSGDIGGSGSQEFMVAADSGEDAILVCPGCGYSANVEKAESRFESTAGASTDPRPMEVVPTPDVRTVEELDAFFPDIAPGQMVKSIHYTATSANGGEDFAVLVLIRGDQEINEIKLLNHVSGLSIRPAYDKEITKRTGAAVGFAGPVDLADGIRVVADDTVRGMANLLCGVNRTDHHGICVNVGRDFPEPEFADLRLARPGEPCKECECPLTERRGIEVGHIFKLGTKYSEAMGATVLDGDGKTRPLVMGCYGIGVSRVAAAAVEQNHDDWGICWPLPIAPFEVVVVPVDVADDELRGVAEDLYAKLWDAGVEALLDDRPLKPGVKFKDADLIGLPYKVVVGRSYRSDGTVEFKSRTGGKDAEHLPADSAAQDIASRIAAARSGNPA